MLACEDISKPSSHINFLLGYEEWILTLDIYSLEEETTCQKSNPTNETNFCKQIIQRIKSKSMCWTY
jgi:hypothetical protein